MNVDKRINRLHIQIDHSGLSAPSYTGGVKLGVYASDFNAVQPSEEIQLSVDELRDLRFLCDEALRAAERVNRDNDIYRLEYANRRHT